MKTDSTNTKYEPRLNEIIIEEVCKKIKQRYIDIDLRYKYESYEDEWLVVFNQEKYDSNNEFIDFILSLEDEIKEKYNIDIATIFLPEAFEKAPCNNFKPVKTVYHYESNSELHTSNRNYSLESCIEGIIMDSFCISDYGMVA